MVWILKIVALVPPPWRQRRRGRRSDDLGMGGLVLIAKNGQ